jgi:hypothetical protein
VDEHNWAKIHCIYRLVVAVYAVGLSLGFVATLENVEKGQDTKRCWYQYGPTQIWVDMSFMVPILLFDIRLFFRLLSPERRPQQGAVSSTGNAFTKENLDALSGDYQPQQEQEQQQQQQQVVVRARPHLSAQASCDSLSSELGDTTLPTDLREHYRKLSKPAKDNFLAERAMLSDIHFRVAFLLAVSIVTTFLSLFVAGSIGSLQERGLKGESMRGSPLSLLFILVGVQDGMGFLIAVLFATDAHAYQRYSELYTYLQHKVRKYVYDIDEQKNCRLGDMSSSREASEDFGDLTRECVNLQLDELATTMSEDRELVHDRRFRFAKYRDCFRGIDLVTWLITHRKAANRVEAESVGMKLMARGLIHHVTREHLFYDKEFFYRFDVHEFQAGDSPRTQPVLVTSRATAPARLGSSSPDRRTGSLLAVTEGEDGEGGGALNAPLLPQRAGSGSF